MCVMSMVMDHYSEKWNDWVNKPYSPTVPVTPEFYPVIMPLIPQPTQLTPEEIAEFRKLLERARKYDRDNGEPDCELAEKKELLENLAKKLGVDILFPEASSTPGSEP